MGEVTTRDDYKDTIAYPRLCYPGMLLAITSGSDPEQYVTSEETGLVWILKRIEELRK